MRDISKISKSRPGKQMPILIYPMRKERIWMNRTGDLIFIGRVAMTGFTPKRNNNG